MEASEPVMISALEHYSYCPRQCALIHVEQTFQENLYTMRGRDVHDNVDLESSCKAAGIRYERALPIWSRKLNLIGKADLVEFHADVPYPVEYKSGRHRAGRHESLQLCAQALCLEEMLGVTVPKGAIYWHGSRERKEIEVTETMRARVEEVTVAVREMIVANRVPGPVNDKRCKECSLKESCLPQVVGEKERCHTAAKELFEVK
jgi:CRISPR-associated exonuclease Cas4